MDKYFLYIYMADKYVERNKTADENQLCTMIIRFIYYVNITKKETQTYKLLQLQHGLGPTCYSQI